MIKVSNLSVHYKERVVFNNDNYIFLDQGLYILKGESGVGKTTLLKAICNKCKYEGTITIDDKKYEDNDLCVSKKAISLFDNDLFFENKTLRENVDCFINLNESKSALLDIYLKKYDLESEIDFKIKYLSRGQRDLVKLIIGIISDCKYVLYDEALASLDPENRKSMLEDLKLISKSRCIIVVSHDDFALEYADKIYNFSRKEKIQVNIDKEELYQRENKKSFFRFNLFSFIIVFLSIVSIFAIENGVQKSMALKDVSNPSVLQLRLNDTSKKEQLMAYIDGNENIVDYDFKNGDNLMKTEIRISLYNYGLSSIEFKPIKYNQNDAYIHCEDNLDLKDNEFLISSTLNEVLQKTIEGYKIPDLSMDNICLNNKFFIKGVYEKDDISIKVGDNSLFFKDEDPTDNIVIKKGLPEIYENENMMLYISKNIFVEGRNFSRWFTNLDLDFFTKYNISLISYTELFDEENVIYINTNFDESMQEYIYKSLTDINNLDSNSMQIKYFRKFENNFTLIEGNLPQNEHEVVAPIILKDYDFNEDEIKISGYYKCDEIYFTGDYKYQLYASNYYKILSADSDYIFLGCKNIDEVKDDLKNKFNINSSIFKETKIDFYFEMFDTKIAIFIIVCFPSLIVMGIYVYEMVFQKKQFQIILFNQRNLKEIYKENYRFMLNNFLIAYYLPIGLSLILLCLLLILYHNVFSPFMYLLMGYAIGFIFMIVVQVIMKLIFKRYLKEIYKI